jgi:hypothetical protein
MYECMYSYVYVYPRASYIVLKPTVISIRIVKTIKDKLERVEHEWRKLERNA